MLLDDELAAMRAEAALALPDTCTIQTATETNTKGSVAVTYANTYTNVPCRLAANSGHSEGVSGEKLTAVAGFILTVAFDQAIAATNRVVMGGVTFEIISVANEVASYRTTRRAYLTRVD